MAIALGQDRGMTTFRPLFDTLRHRNQKSRTLPTDRQTLHTRRGWPIRSGARICV